MNIFIAELKSKTNKKFILLFYFEIVQKVTIKFVGKKIRERVRTSKITLSKVKKRTPKVQKEYQKSEHQKFPLKGSER